jgi:thiamine pyrophosphate-dependent acetolactate synthase large subunit-like protein
MTSGGLGTMGYGLPAALGVQVAHPDALVIDIAGDASVQMVMQEMSTAVQFNLPMKIFILNNHYGWGWCASGSSCCTETGCRTPTRTRCRTS